MVFANLGLKEKDAFFSLLDEYFTSRPEIFGSSASDGSSTTGTNPFRRDNAASAASAASKFVSSSAAGLKQFVGGGAGTKSTAIGHTASREPETDAAPGGSVADRIAALSAARNQDSADRPGSGSTSNLTPTRKFGNVDTSSAKNMFTSIRNTSSNPSKSFQASHSSAIDNLPSAFPPTNNASKFGPPPTRTPVSAPVPPEPAVEPVQEDHQKEWVEALFDFESSEPGDLDIKEGQRILLLERTSDDWWTGEVDGRKGLFPVSYAKLL